MYPITFDWYHNRSGILNYFYIKVLWMRIKKPHITKYELIDHSKKSWKKYNNTLSSTTRFNTDNKNKRIKHQISLSRDHVVLH